MEKKKELTPMQVTNYYWGIVSFLFIIVLLISGCSYENCLDECARIKCGYSDSLRASYSDVYRNDFCRSNLNLTMREYCYEECK